jgi:hypothetical protein
MNGFLNSLVYGYYSLGDCLKRRFLKRDSKDSEPNYYDDSLMMFHDHSVEPIQKSPSKQQYSVVEVMLSSRTSTHLDLVEPNGSKRVKTSSKEYYELFKRD